MDLNQKEKPNLFLLWEIWLKWTITIKCTHVCNERVQRDGAENTSEKRKDPTNIIFLSHHEEDAVEDMVGIDSKIIDVFFAENDADLVNLLLCHSQ